MHHNGLNCGSISNAHKRTTSKPDFSYVPSPKRQQLNNFWAMECQTSFPNPICSKLSAKSMFDSLLEEKQMLESHEVSKLPDLSNYDDGNKRESGEESEEMTLSNRNIDNIANTPAYIKSLINLMQAPDEGYSDDCIPMSREESTNQLPSYNIPSLTDIKSEDAELAQININNNNIDCLKDDEDENDDAFLNNLPTSVDDLQNKELHLKLERHYSSPIVSRRQSPALYVGRSSLASERSYALSSAHSIASDDENLDAEDLEVAMINESFEEQQKQTMLYEGADLKSLFYSMPNQKLSESALDEANLAYILNAGNLSPPRKSFDCTDDSNMSKNDYDSLKDLMLTPSAVDYDTDNMGLLLTPKTSTYTDCASATNSKFSRSFKGAGGSPPTLNEEFSSDGLDAQLENMILRGDFDTNLQATGSKKHSMHEIESAFFESLSPTCDTPEILATEAAEALAKNVVASLFASDSSPPRSFGVEDNINLTDSLCKCIEFLSDSEADDGEVGTALKEKSSISNVDSRADLTSSSSQVDFSDLSKLSNDEQKVPESVLDSWEDLDESEMEQKIIDTVKMKQQKSTYNTDVLDAPSTSDWSFDVLPHVLEASNINAKTSDDDLNDTLVLMGLENIWSKRVDDGHALIVFPNGAKAIEALMNKRYPCLKLRPLSDAAKVSQQKAIAWKNILQPHIPRPATNVCVARRMIENTLGVRSTISKEVRKKEDDEIKLARASKKLKQNLWGDAE